VKRRIGNLVFVTLPQKVQLRIEVVPTCSQLYPQVRLCPPVTNYMKEAPASVSSGIIVVTMADFADIPAAGDAWADEEREDTHSEDEVLEEEKDGKWQFNGKHIYVTWSKSKIEEKEVFHQKLLAILPTEVRMFGGRELHQDGTPHYHVVFSFTEKVHWPDAANKFSIEGDTNVIRFEKPKPCRRISDFLEKTMAYCSKDGDTFGERLCLEGAVAELKKRKWQDIVDEPDEKKAWTRVREIDPRAYMVNYPALERAIVSRKRTKVAPAASGRPKREFRVPNLMRMWMDRYVVRKEWKGRPKSLVIVGDALVGKSAWAESEGNPIVMNSAWCMKSIVEGASHIVVSDVKPLAFGYAGQSHWRDVLGGQKEFNARDFQQAMRTIPWGLPCIWTCNFDSDPRKDKAVAEYIRKVSWVVEIRDRPDEHGWGKLYVPQTDDAEEEDGCEWLEALAEANSFMDE